MDSNNSVKKPYILSIDDDQDMRNLVKRYMTSSGYRIDTADNGAKGLEMIEEERPDLILLDVVMPELDGYEVCAQLQKNNKTAYIPVIFATSLEDEQDKARAFSVGAVDYLVKPFSKDILLQKVNMQLNKKDMWKSLKSTRTWDEKRQQSDFMKFKRYLFDQLKLSTSDKQLLTDFQPSEVYEMGLGLGIKENIMASYMASFMKLPYISHINPDEIALGVLPTPFCKVNKMVPLNDDDNMKVFAISNPFNLELLDILENFAGSGHTLKIKLTGPENIDMLGVHPESKLTNNILDIEDVEKVVTPVKEEIISIAEVDIEKSPVIYNTNNLILKAISERASDIHIEPKGNSAVVRFRIDGVMQEMFSLEPKTAAMVISRLKVYANMDIAERRRPQDGGFTTVINNKRYNFRLSTALTPHGESLIMRILETEAIPKNLKELGMTKEQSDTMINLGCRNQGLVLFVGPTGSGKTTSVYSLLHQMDCKSRSLITVEDPVEYHIPFANQEQVNEKAGITFEALLKSSVRQDPDVLFVGEVRDSLSAKICIDFASTGHLTISSLHTSNATTAIYRIERLGIDRKAMANAIIGIVAQRLLRKLCAHCKEIRKISKDEIEMLLQFTDDIPEKVAQPVGCHKCNHSGYSGREGVYEILEFDEEISEMVRSNIHIAKIRAFAQERGDTLISNHAIKKLEEHVFTPKDVYEKVLIDDIRLKGSKDKAPVAKTTKATAEVSRKESILVVDDNEDCRKLITHFLKDRGYKITITSNAIDAFICMDKHHYDLVLSDINMPNLDGFKLMEIMDQKGIDIPVIFLTARTDVEDEKTGLDLGAVDYIKKPINKDILLLRVKNALEKV